MTVPYRKDPIFKLWTKVESQCHQQVADASPRLKSYLIDEFPIEEFKNILTTGHHIAITNTIVVDSDVDKNLIEKTADSFYGVYYHPYDVSNFNIHKDFNCFINRMDTIRQSWLYQLIRRQLLDLGYVSFNMDISRIPELNGLTLFQAFEKQFNEQLKIFRPEHEKICNQVPYKNFNDNGDLTEIILDSKFSIILETYFHNNNLVTFSEKIFRCLQLPRPWVLYSHKHAVHYLRVMGFDVLDDIVDHSYDTIEFAIERQVEILNLVEKLVNLDIIPLQTRLRQAAEHNQQLLKKFADTWQDDFQETISRALAKL